jgi:hypothetical protein
MGERIVISVSERAGKPGAPDGEYDQRKSRCLRLMNGFLIQTWHQPSNAELRLNARALEAMQTLRMPSGKVLVASLYYYEYVQLLFPTNSFLVTHCATREVKARQR